MSKVVSESPGESKLIKWTLTLSLARRSKLPFNLKQNFILTEINKTIRTKMDIVSSLTMIQKIVTYYWDFHNSRKDTTFKSKVHDR